MMEMFEEDQPIISEFMISQNTIFNAFSLLDALKNISLSEGVKVYHIDPKVLEDIVSSYEEDYKTVNSLLESHFKHPSDPYLWGIQEQVTENLVTVFSIVQEFQGYDRPMFTEEDKLINPISATIISKFTDYEGHFFALNGNPEVLKAELKADLYFEAWVEIAKHQMGLSPNKFL